MTHSFRIDSRLTSKLSGPCTFVYYSPYYFADDRERKILKTTSESNLNAFYFSLNEFQKELQEKGSYLYVYKKSDPIEHINQLAKEYGYTHLIIDQPLFAMWKTIDLLNLSIPYTFIDSDLIDDECFKMTAKSRWMSHAKKISTEKLYTWNSEIKHLGIPKPNIDLYPYPEPPINYLLDVKSILDRAFDIAPTYGETRDRHNGQTQLSTLFQNGMLDPHNVFFQIAKMFFESGSDFSKNEGAHAAMLRQFAFREMTLIQARRSNLTMENSPLEWAKEFLTSSSLSNLLERKNSDSKLTFEKIKTANTGDELIDKILKESNKVSVMPNRARMFFAGWLFYNSPSGKDALNWLIDTFDLLFIDGQCPTNYIQSTSSMNMQYGKVMLLNRDRVQHLLNY